MTTTAERAKDLVETLMFEHEVWPLRATELITQALHQAQNDKLEEAAQCVRDNCLPAECHYALEAINALKHED